MKTRLTISAIFLIIFACTNKKINDTTFQQHDYPIKIDLTKAMTNPKDIKLSDVADSIVYIPLEYVKDNPVGAILDFKYFSNNIFIHVGGIDGGFLRFDGKGKFLNKIGTEGRGPEEYTPGSTFSVIGTPKRFYVLCNYVPRRLLEFDYDGTFLTEVMTAYPSVYRLEAISSDRFLFLAGSDTSFHHLADLKDRINKSLDVVPHPLLSNPNLKGLKQFDYPGARSGIYYNKYPLFWDELSMDTIFNVLNDSIYPKYILDKGSEGAPFEKTYSQNTTLGPLTPPERWNYLLPISFTETSHDIFIMVIFKNKELYLINYNKASQNLSSMKTPFILPDKPKSPVAITPRFENDIDGGISFGPGKPNKEGDIWTYKFEAIDFKNKLTKEYLQTSKALNPEKKKSLIQLVNSIKEDDNPIIMVVYLKK